MVELLSPNYYFFSWYAVPLLVVAAVLFAIGTFVLKQSPKSQTNRTFFFLTSGLFVWLTGYATMYCSNDAALALHVYRHYTFLGVVLIAINVYAFSVAWLDLWRAQKWMVVGGYLSAAFFYAAACKTDLVVPFVDRYYWGYYSRYGWLGAVFFGTFVFFFFAAFFNFIYRLKHPIETVSKSQIWPVIIAFCFAITGACDFIPKLWHVEIYPFGYLSAFFWIMGMAYAIVKYRVMDIQTVIHKTIFWLTTTLACLLPAALAAYFLRDWLLGLSSLALSAAVFIFAAAFIPYVRFIQPLIDQWFQRRHWDLRQALQKFNDELIHLKTLEDLAHHILQTISRAIYPQDLHFLLWDEDVHECLVFTPDGQAYKVPSAEKEGFFRFLGRDAGIVIRDYVMMDPRLEEIKEEARTYFESSGAEICVPVILEEKLIGAINLSRKTNLKAYAAAEIRFLSDLRGSTAIAISNSLRLIAMQASLRKWNEELEKKVDERTRELKDAQAQLIQAEKLATIGTLAGGVAHEINNPLAAIMTNAQMLLQDNISSETRESLDLIEEAAKRCREIVQKLMKYSRKSPQQEARETVSLNEIIENTISFLKYQIEQDSVRIETELQAVPSVSGNANEFSQVFTNLILNARDAVAGGGKEPRVTIRTFEKNGSVYAEVADNGVGIPKENLSKVFDPFFTTKDVGKGTGLGLSIVQGIVQKHGGEIKIDSQVGKGTIVSVTFPKSA